MKYWDFFPTDDPPIGPGAALGLRRGRNQHRARGGRGDPALRLPPDQQPPRGAALQGRCQGVPRRQPAPPAPPTPYNGLITTAEDPAYDADQEDLQVLYRPLFMTSFVLADFITDHDCFGARTVVISSAPSKTSYGAAFLLDGIHRAGLTSAGNREFTESLGCYDEVRTYAEVEELTEGPAVYVDVAGDPVLRRRVHERLAPVHSAVVGAAHHDAEPDLAGSDDLPGSSPTFFFAPDQMRKRYADWGPDGVELRHAEAWARLPIVAGWVDVTLGAGPTGLDAAWKEVLAGATPPRVGHVIVLGD